MSLLEDIRKVPSDYLTLELRELKRRIEAAERQVKEREVQAFKNLAERLAAIEEKLRATH